jgi:hypothetical protein
MSLTLAQIQTAGLVACLGALIYALGDVLMLAAKFDPAAFPNLQPHLKLLSGIEKMAGLPWPRLMWGGLLGVFATPLVLAGLLPLYAGLAPAGAWALWPPLLLLGVGFILSPFVHGSFIFIGEYVQALNRLSPEAQPVVVEMVKHYRQALAISYGLLALGIVAGSIWFSAAVALGGTRFPLWMAAVNPITLVIVWLGLRRLLPRLTDFAEGAGFNLAFLAFFALATMTLAP